MQTSPHALQEGQGGTCLGAAETAHYQATLFTSSRGLLTKRLDLGADGTLHKQPAANMTAGTAELVKVRSLRELDALMGGMTSAQAIAYGTTAQARVSIVTQRREPGDGSAIARTREHFAFHAGPGFMLLDHDGMPGKSLNAKELRRQLFAAVPELEGAPMLARPSVSAGVRGPDGALLTPYAKWHLYLAVADARLIPAAGEALQARLWAAGLGWCEVGKAGQVLPRTLVDALTNQPERLDFAAAPELGKGLRQEWQPGQFYDEHAAPFDLSRITVDEATRARAEANKAAARAAIEQQRQEKREAWEAAKAAAPAKPARRTTTRKAAAAPMPALPDVEGDEWKAALLADAPRRFPLRPYCSDDPKRYGPRVRDLRRAITKAHIQVNPPTARLWSVFDVDRPEAAHAWEAASLPPPTWAAINPENGHAHIAWGLRVPVVLERADNNEKALRFLAAIEGCISARLGADASYHGGLTKNPLHPRWIVHHPGRLEYDLHDLAEHLPELRTYRPPRRAQEQAGTGRNVHLFTELQRWAVRAIRDHWSNGPGGWAGWLERCKAQAGAVNAKFPAPLAWEEVCHVAKSVARWTWKKTTPEGFSAWQAVQGKKAGIASGKARRLASEGQRATARLMALEGRSQRAIAAELGVTQKTVSVWLREK